MKLRELSPATRLAPNTSAPGARRVSSAPAPAAGLPADRLIIGVVAIATLIAAALRLPFLGHQSVWFDETYTRTVVGEPTLSAVWHQIKATESTPPLYYVLTWLLGGRSAATMRLIPALALVAAVPIGYLSVRRLVGERAAACAAVLLAVNPELVSYATDARSYGLLVLTALLTVWGFSAVLESGTWRRYGAWAIASVACVWTHYFGFFVVGAEVVVMLALRPEAWRATAAWSGAIAAGAAPLLALLSAQSDNRAFFIATIPLQTRFTHAVREFAMGPNVPRAPLEVAGLAIIAIAVALGAVGALRGGEGPRAVLAIATIGFFVPLAMSLLGIKDRFDARNVLAVLPLVMALAAPALLRLRAAPLIAYAALAVLVSLWVATNWRYENLDYGRVLARAEAIDPTAPIITPTSLNVPVAEVYLRRRSARSQQTARTAWVLVEPFRGYGQRALHEGPEPPALPGFTVRRELSISGFRVILFAAPQPTPVQPSIGYVFPATR